MASTGEPDRKRRHFSSISPSEAAAAVKKQPFFWPSSEDKVLSSSSTFVHALYIYICLLLIQSIIDFQLLEIHMLVSH